MANVWILFLGLHAENYNDNSDGSRDLVFWTNPKNEDIFHPTQVSGITFTNVNSNNKVLFDRPSLG